MQNPCYDWADLQEPFEEGEAETSPQLYGFAMIHTAEITRFLPYIQDKSIERRDFALLFVLISYINTKNGQIKISSSALAEDLGVKDSDVRASMSRLKKALILVFVKDKKTNDCFYMLNPSLISVGAKARRGYLRKIFMSAVND